MSIRTHFHVVSVSSSKSPTGSPAMTEYLSRIHGLRHVTHKVSRLRQPAQDPASLNPFSAWTTACVGIRHWVSLSKTLHNQNQFLIPTPPWMMRNQLKNDLIMVSRRFTVVHLALQLSSEFKVVSWFTVVLLVYSFLWIKVCSCFTVVLWLMVGLILVGSPRTASRCQSTRR